MKNQISYAYYSKDPPCRDCENRVPGCHSKCEQYQEYQKKCKESRNKAKDELAGYYILMGQISRSRRK